MVKLTPGALLNLFKQTPKTNPPSGTISKIPNKQELERAAMRDLELFEKMKGREPTIEETKLILDNNLGALGSVNIGDLVNLGALKDIPYSPGKSGKTTATEMGQAGRPTSPTKTREGLTKSTGTIETGDPLLDEFANGLMFDGTSPMGGTADTIKGIIDDNDEIFYNDYYTDIFRNKDGKLMGYRNNERYARFKDYYSEEDIAADELGRNKQELLEGVNIYAEEVPDHSDVVNYFKNTAQEYLDDKGLGDTIYLFRQGRLARGPLSFSMSPVDKPNIYNTGQRVDVYAVKKKDIKAIPNLHKKGQTDYSYEEEILADGEDVSYVGSIGNYAGEAGDIEEGVKFVHSDSPYTYKDNELGKKAKIDSEQFLNQLKGDK